jgi:hypothetical protein
MRRQVWGVAILFVAGACTESGESWLGDGSVSDSAVADTSGGDIGVEEVGADALPETAPALGCSVAEALFMPYCERCHHPGDNFPDLGVGAMKYLVDAPAIAYPGETLVVPGDPAASLLYRKVHGPGDGEGLAMPPDDQIPVESVTALESWILAGAPACEGWEDPGPMAVEAPAPGGEIVFSAAPFGFQTTQPGWSEDGPCSASQWWMFSGDTESPNMHPGQDCIGCHTREREGPAYSFAGTVYPSLDEASDCRGVSGVTVEILDAADQVIAMTTSNSSGNFFIRKSSVAFRPFRARLTYEGREREMQLIQSESGDCNTCHDSAGRSGSLGRIVAP